MAKDGKAKVLTPDEFSGLMTEISKHRYPEKNRLIFHISFKLALRVQEISLLRLQEVIEISARYTKGYKVKDILILPKSFTKGARAASRHATSSPKRTSVRFTIAEFDRLVERIQSDALAGKESPVEAYYPLQKPRKGKTRELPIVDQALIEAIESYIDLRISKNETLKPSSPLILSQKGGSYSPNTLQDHMRKILRKWAGIQRASSHSGRRGVATDLIHNQSVPLSTVQQILGHKNPSTTIGYDEAPEEEMGAVLGRLSDTFKMPE